MRGHVTVTVGRVARAHGVRGEVVVDVRTDSPAERFAAGAVLDIEGVADRSLTVRRARWHSGRLLVLFEGVADRDAAEALRGAQLTAQVDAHERPDDPEEFYDHQLVGLSVVASDGKRVGVVREVVHTPAQDLLAVEDGSGGQVLIPFVADIVPEVDLPASRLVIEPPPGLLDLNPPAETERG